jgi:hypothetical protein
MAVITIVQLELAINRARELHPPIDYVLHPSVSALAEVYGRMIYERTSLADLDTMPAAIRAEIMQWLGPAAAGSGPAEAESSQACYYRPGDPGCEACEACQ